MKQFNRLFVATFALIMFAAIPQMSFAQWSPEGMPMDFGDYYDDIPTTNPGDISLEPMVAVYPNPSTDSYLRVMYRQLDGPATITVYDLSGRQFFTTEVGTDGEQEGQVRLTTESLTPGTYFIALANTRARVAKKVIIR